MTWSCFSNYSARDEQTRPASSFVQSLAMGRFLTSCMCLCACITCAQVWEKDLALVIFLWTLFFLFLRCKNECYVTYIKKNPSYSEKPLLFLLYYSVCTFSLVNSVSLTPSGISPRHVLDQSEALILGSRISAAITGMKNVDHADNPRRKRVEPEEEEGAFNGCEQTELQSGQ